MKSSHTSIGRFPAKLVAASKAGLQIRVALLALIGVVSVAGGVGAATLGAPTRGPGPYDTDFGVPISAGFPPVCAPYSEPTLAAGPIQFSSQSRPQPVLEQSVNYNYDLNDQTDTSLFSEPLADFFANGLLPSGFLIGKPQVLYDKTGDPNGYGRFVLAAAAQLPRTQQSWITLGSTYIPEGYLSRADCTFAIDANHQVNGSFTNYYADEPRIGQSATDLVVSAEMKSFTDNSPKGAKLWIIPKAAVYNVPFQDCKPPHFPGSAIVRGIGAGFQNSDGTRAVAIVPANSHNTSSSVTYLVSAYPNGGPGLNLWTLDTLHLTLSPAVKGRAVPTHPYSPPLAASQPGTSTQVSTGGKSAPTELVNAVYQPASGLWTAHTTSCPPGQGLGSCLTWYQIAPTTATALQDASFGFSNAYVFAPWVLVNSFGDAVFPLEISGPVFM